MADLKRWFKVWTTILEDPHFQELSLEDIGRWVLLGAMTASVGAAGRLDVPGSGRRLCEALRVPDLTALKIMIERLPSVLFEEGKNRDGGPAVTWKNWHTFQKDSTAAERMKTLRSKRRGEKKRREKKRLPPSSALPSEGFLEKLKNNPAYKGIEIDRELLKMDAWLSTPAGKGRKKTPRFIVNWLNRIETAVPRGKSLSRRLWEEAEHDRPV